MFNFDEDGWFVSLIMYITMLLELLYRPLRAIATRQPLAYPALVISVDTVLIANTVHTNQVDGRLLSFALVANVVAIVVMIVAMVPQGRAPELEAVDHKVVDPL